MDFDDVKRRAAEQAAKWMADERVRGAVGAAMRTGARVVEEAKQVGAAVRDQLVGQTDDDTRSLKDRLDRLREDADR